MSYIGDPINVDQVLYDPVNSIVHQSLDSHLGAEPTNGDGFGIGWYVEGEPIPVRYRSTHPAWNDQNLMEITSYLHSPCFVAHVRAAIGSPVQQTNCHPFRHGEWMFVHNGFVDGWSHVRRELAMAVDPSLYPSIEGSADSEILFLLALTFGLNDDAPAALEQMVRVVEAACESVGAHEGIQMTIAATNGKVVHAARHATSTTPRSLYHSGDVEALQAMYPDNARLQQLTRDARFIVSEPLSDLPGAFEEVLPNTMISATPNGYEIRPFLPRART
jgi:glutamine amidotransferase